MQRRSLERNLCNWVLLFIIVESFRGLRKFSRLRRGAVPLPERGLSPFGCLAQVSEVR
jgi:hypothetical protein